jgi:hypothetical protein
VVVGECEGNGVWHVSVHKYERASVGVLLACERERAMNNNNVNVCTRKAEGGRVAVYEARK